MSLTFFFSCFLLGLVTALPLLLFAQNKSIWATRKLLGRCLAVVALLYVAFAFVQLDAPWLLIELLGLAFYASFYWLACRYSLLWLALGWALHVVWDVGLHLAGAGAHIVPTWYAVFCLSFDFAVAAYLVYRLCSMPPAERPV